MSIIGSNILAGASGQGAAGYEIERSLRFNSPDSAHLSRTPGTAGNRKTWTWAGWVKRSGLSGSASYTVFAGDASVSGGLEFTRIRILNDEIWLQDTDLVGTTFNISWQSQAVLRDPSAWYHIVFKFDTTQASSANAVALWINGVSQSLDFVAFNGSYTQNRDGFVNATNAHLIGAGLNGSNVAEEFFPGYLADIHFIDGQALDPSSFGEFDTNGVWQPIEYAGTYGTNGFRLPFSDNSGTSSTTLGKDAAGSNNWTPNNFSVTAGAGNDSLVDSPTNYGEDTGAGGEVRGNYCTLNPLDSPNNTGGALTNGNLDFAGNTSAYSMYRGTIQIPAAGKWYYECQFNGTAYTPRNFASQNSGVGVCKTNVTVSSPTDGNVLWIGDSGYGCNFSGTSTDFAGQVVDSGDIVGVAINRDANTFEFFLNGTSVETGTIGVASGTALNPYAFCYSNTQTTLIVNFGQRPFAYTAPSGFKALCTTNLPEPTIADGSTAMDAVLWTGNATARSITGLNFSPDFVWGKDRTGSGNHNLYDIIRGANKELRSNTADSERTNTQGLTSFDSNGFSLGTSSDSDLNINGRATVGWCWDAGSSTVTNNDGSSTSQVRANASAGFSVVTYTGTGSAATVGHGLGVAPAFFVTKRRDSSSFGNWTVYHSSIGTQYLELNGTGAAATDSTRWSSAATSTVFNIGSGGNVNVSGGTFVAYCFAPVAGYSSFGSYTGNASADGTFVYTGFRPAFVMLKASSAAPRNWVITDYKINNYNATGSFLTANTSNPQDSGGLIDFLSNGFKLRLTSSNFNGNGVTYIYAAFAEHPFQYARAR